MQFKRILSMALILSLSFVLAACGGGGAATPASNPTDAADSGDTEATEDAGDDTGDTGGSADLPETASADVPTGGTLTVNYPSGWTSTAVAGSITLNSSDMTEVVNVSYYPAATGADAAAVMNSLSAGFAATGTASEVTEMELGGKAASSMTVTVSAAGTEATTTYYIVTLEDGYALVSGNADAATMEAIAGSASFSS